MYCEKCGHEMKNGRCPNCGFPVGEPQWEEQKSKKKSGKKIGIIILSVVIVLIFAAAILAAIFWLKKENTQKKFDTHIEKGQKYLEEMDYETHKRKISGCASRHLFFLCSQRTARLRQQAVERASAGL